MEIDNVESLSKHIAKLTDPEEINELITLYGNKRATISYTRGWQRCRIMFQQLRHQRLTKIRQFVPNYEPDGTISINTFNKYFYKIVDELRDIKNGKYDIKDFQDFLFISLGDIKVDRRLCFKKE
jgi:hypothetical protein